MNAEKDKPKVEAKQEESASTNGAEATKTLDVPPIAIREDVLAEILRGTDTATNASLHGGKMTYFDQFWRAPIFYFVVVVIMAVVMNWVHTRMPSPKVVHQLPDLFLDSLPYAPIAGITDLIIQAVNIVDIGMFCYLWYKDYKRTVRINGHSSITGMSDIYPINWKDQLLPGEYRVPHNYHYGMWIRYFVGYGLCTVLRTITIVVTSLPATNNKCQNWTPIDNVYKNTFLTIITFGSGSQHCGDLMFSGHSTVITMHFMSFITYGRLVTWALPVFGVVMMVLSWITILFSRSHYTVDVVVAVFIVIMTYRALPESVPAFLAPVMQNPFRKPLQQFAGMSDQMFRSASDPNVVGTAEELGNKKAISLED